MTPRVYLIAAAALACACAEAQQKPEQKPVVPESNDITAAADRTERDRGMDAHRKPKEMLAFFGAQPGLHVAELGAGGGYSTELFARSVAPNGTVIAQDTPNWDGPGLQKLWQARLASPANKNVTHVMKQWDDPLPSGTKDLDAIYSVAVYHDAVNEQADVSAMNRAVWNALKPGGAYYIIDNSAQAGTGAVEVGRLHRIDEQLVVDEVTRAGFKLAGSADFLKNPKDARDWNADSGVNKTHDQDRFALKFVKGSAPVASNPLLDPWEGPWAGVPPFGKFKAADIRTALEKGMTDALAEIDRIADETHPPDYENTIVALERAGLPLDRASTMFSIFVSTMNDDEMQKVEADMSPKLAAFNDKIVQNQKLFG